MKTKNNTNSLLKMMRKRSVCLMTALLMLVMTACGSGKDGSAATGSTAQSGTSASGEPESESVYQASFQSLPASGDDDGYGGDAYFAGDRLYYSSGSYTETVTDMEFGIYDANTFEKQASVRASDLFADFLAGQTEAAVNRSTIFTGLNVSEGKIYLLASASLMTAEYENVDSSFLILILDEDGNELSRIDLTDLATAGGEYFYMNGIAADTKGRILLTTDAKLILLSEQGDVTAEIPAEEELFYTQCFALGDSMYVGYQGQSTNWAYVVRKVDQEHGRMAEELTGFPQNFSKVYPDREGGLLALTSQSLYRYRLEDQTSEMILSWEEANILGDQVMGVSETADGSFRVFLYDWNTGTSEIASLTKTNRSEIAQVKDIYINTLYSDQQLSTAVIAFNKSQNEYRANINVFLDWETNPDLDYGDALTNLQNSITGENPPDLVTMGWFSDMEGLAKKGLFEDLTGYVQGSGIDLSAFLPGIIESSTYAGKLVAIPKSFSVSTLIGSTADLGKDRAGWTVDEMIDYAQAHPGKQLIDYQNRESMMEIFFTFTMDSFVDPETGECRFDSPEFQKMLTFLSGVNAEINWDDTRSTAEMVSDGDVLMTQAMLTDASDIQLYDAIFSGACTFIGYPTMDGRPTAMLNPEGGIAMLSSSSEKEGAWKFLEFYNNMDGLYTWGMSPDRNKIREKIDKDIKEKTHENYGMSTGDWYYDYHGITREEGDRFLELLDLARAPRTVNQTIRDIITEESAAFFEGQKSVEEVTETIQSRASLYMMENR